MFYIIFSFIILQRISELFIAKRNEKQMKNLGAIEVGADHYKWIVTLHVTFLLSLFFEVTFFDKQLIHIWPFILTLLLITQLVRYWVIQSLGMYWNTKIIVLKGARVQTKGPFKFIRHPNYLVVSLEIILLPVLFSAYFTSVVFTILNAIVLLKVRIPIEEKALSSITVNYKTLLKNG
jgi:methyltransferase